MYRDSDSESDDPNAPVQRRIRIGENQDLRQTSKKAFLPLQLADPSKKRDESQPFKT